jgi:hypothetical protein
MAGARRLEDHIRVGLEEPVTLVTGPQAVVPVDPLEVVSFGKTARQHVREFGALFAAICFCIAAWKMYRGHDVGITALYWIAPGAVFATLGFCAPRLLRPLWRGWMGFAHYLSIVMTAALLGLVWCLGFLPIAALVRVVGIKRMDLSFRSDRASYWEQRDPKYDDFKRLKLQY